MLGRHNCSDTDGVSWQDRVVAVRLPYMSTSNYTEAKEMDLANGHFDAGMASNALLVLILPCDPERTWQTEELDVVTAIAGQVFAAEPNSWTVKEIGNLN